MSADDSPDREQGDQSANSTDGNQIDPDDIVGADVRERLGEGADRAIDQFDEGLIDLLAWILETETRARIYISLRKEPDQTSDEIAERTGLYPSTVREALASLHQDAVVAREKRQNTGAGNNPYEYSAIPPSELVSDVVDDIQQQLNDVFNLDRYMSNSTDSEDETEPVTITVTDEESPPGDGTPENGDASLDGETDHSEDPSDDGFAADPGDDHDEQ